MAGKDDEPTPPGWYREHDDPGTLRWWDGSDWTDDTMAAPSDGGPVPAPSSSGPAAGRPAGPTGAPRRRAEPAPVPPGRPRPRPQADPGSRSPRPTGTRRGAPAPSASGRRAARSPGGGTARPSRSAGARPPQRMAPAAARAGGARRPAGRTVQSERVVRRRPSGPGPGVRVALRALLIAAVVGVVYLGYVQLRDAEAPDARTVSAEPAEAPDQRFRPVADAVLSLDDLPGGWVAQAHDPGVDDICQGRIPRSVIVPEDVASAAFTQGASGPFLTTILARFEDEGTARAFLDLTERVVESCREYEANGATVQLGPLEYPRFGDDTFVAAAGGDSQFGAISGRIVYVRVGSLVASVESIAFGETEVSDQLVEHLANLLAKRLRAL